MIALAFLALAQAGAAPGAAAPMSDQEFCQIMQPEVASMARSLPMHVNSTLRVDAMAIICPARSYAIRKTVSLDLSEMEANWQATEQVQWNAVICNNEAFAQMARRGWRFSESFMFRSGELVRIEANCQVN